MFKFHDVKQNTDEWFELRGGRLTSSKLGVIMAVNNDYLIVQLGKFEFAIANTKIKKVLSKRFDSKVNAESSLLKMKKSDLSKSFTSVAKKYATRIANEQIQGRPISDNYSNGHMERGHEQEPIARSYYERETFTEVTNGGFFGSDFIGCSPDGMVFTDGLIEIKCVIDSVHFDNVKRQGVDPAYKWQCIGNLKFTGRDWIDFVSYCDEFPEDKKLFIHRLYKKDLSEQFDMIDSRVDEFKKLVAESKSKILESKYINY